jgi:hypothetical protein
VQSDPKSIENRQEMCWHREELNQIFSALAIAFLNYLWRDAESLFANLAGVDVFILLFVDKPHCVQEVYPHRVRAE